MLELRNDSSISSVLTPRGNNISLSYLMLQLYVRSLFIVHFVTMNESISCCHVMNCRVIVRGDTESDMFTIRIVLIRHYIKMSFIQLMANYSNIILSI